jgi:plastocyanin
MRASVQFPGIAIGARRVPSIDDSLRWRFGVRARIVLVILYACAIQLPLRAQTPVTLQVEVASSATGNKDFAKNRDHDFSNVVVWLSPIGASAPANPSASPHPQIVQRDKSFEPHVTVVQVGTAIDFPNKDPYLHNVFSLFDGKRFDLGFYEAGSTKTVHFDKPGISFLFCNIHPEMSAVIAAVDTPYFGLSDRSGRVTILNVPDGKYQLNVWYERSLPDQLKSLSKAVSISGSARSLDPIRVVESPNFSLDHKNKYGQDYIPPAASSPVYGQP